MGRVRIILAGVAALAAGPALAQSSQATRGSITVMDPATVGVGTELGAQGVLRPSSGSANRQVSPGAYTIGGTGGETFSITVPSTVDLTRAGASEQVRMSLTPSQTSGQVPGPVGMPGQTSIGVKGELPVTATTPAGLYVGQFGLTVAYP